MERLRMTEQLDPMEALMTALGRRNSPWAYCGDVEGGKFAMMPKTATDIEAWESRALAMHSRQRTITLAPKPTQNEIVARKLLSRGD